MLFHLKTTKLPCVYNRNFCAITTRKKNYIKNYFNKFLILPLVFKQLSRFSIKTTNKTKQHAKHQTIFATSSYIPYPFKKSHLDGLRQNSKNFLPILFYCILSEKGVFLSILYTKQALSLFMFHVEHLTPKTLFHVKHFYIPFKITLFHVKHYANKTHKTT